MNPIQIALTCAAATLALGGALLARRGRLRAEKGTYIARGWSHPAMQETRDPDVVIRGATRGLAMARRGERTARIGIALVAVGFGLQILALVGIG